MTIDLPGNDRQCKEGRRHSRNNIQIIQRTTVETKGLALFDSMVPNSFKDNKEGDGKMIITGSADNKGSINIGGPNIVAQGGRDNNEITSALKPQRNVRVTSCPAW